MQAVNVTPIMAGGEAFFLIWRSDQISAAISELRNWAQDDRVPFTWFDYARAVAIVRKQFAGLVEGSNAAGDFKKGTA